VQSPSYNPLSRIGLVVCDAQPVTNGPRVVIDENAAVADQSLPFLLLLSSEVGALLGRHLPGRLSLPQPTVVVLTSRQDHRGPHVRRQPANLLQKLDAHGNA
jgi:hypothetical protein